MSTEQPASHSEGMSTPKKYSIRVGTTDFGKEYETKMAILLALRCAGDPNTQDMWMVTNIENCGDFDDIVMCRQTTDGKRVMYFIQLKYQQNPKPIKPQEFKQKREAFYLKKYLNGLSAVRESGGCLGDIESKLVYHIKHNLKETVFILFTNRGTSGVCNFLKDLDDGNNEHLLYINTTSGSIHKFRYEEFNFDLEEEEEKYAEKLYFYQNQVRNMPSDKECVDVAIMNQIKELIRPFQLPDEELHTVFKKFVSYIHEWWKGELGNHFSLTKAVILQKLAQLLLKPHMVRIEPKNTFLDQTVWKDIIRDKKITIVDEDDAIDEFLQSYIHGCLEDCQNSVKRLYADDLILLKSDYNEIYKSWWKRGKVPLLLESTTQESFQFIKHVLTLHGSINIWAILINRTKNQTVEIENSFTTLNDLSKKHVKKILRHPVKLQGRSSIKLISFLTPKLYSVVKVKDIIHILSGSFCIGNEFKPFPHLFIKRSLRPHQGDDLKNPKKYLKQIRFPILLTAGSGTGKSVYLDYIAQAAPTTMWVLKINLLDHEGSYETQSSDDFLKQCNSKILSNSNNRLALTVSETFLKHKNVLVLLDGFNEINLTFRMTAVEIIRRLQNSEYLVCVTTLPATQALLENELGASVIVLNPFNKGDQIHFLLKYFAKQNKQLMRNLERKQLVHSFLHTCLDMAEEHGSSPCNVHNRLETFCDECKGFLRSHYLVTNRHFDFLHLYRSFIANHNNVFE